MISIIATNILILCSIALVAAIILYVASKKFYVEENPKIDEVETLLPGANCGACGKAGCRDFAVACVNSDEQSFPSLYCPVGGKEAMTKVAFELGHKAVDKEETVAVLRCQGSCEKAPIKFEYEGVKLCRLANRIASARSGCPNGCLRLGDCARACKFDALSLDSKTGLPVVDEQKCTSCMACVNVCPRSLFEIRPKGVDGARVYVACRNTQKGAQAKKNCTVACIGCMKCAKIDEKIKIENNLSYIPFDVDAKKYGEELASTCPTGAIVYTKSNRGDNE